MIVMVGTTSKIKLQAIETILRSLYHQETSQFAILAQDVESHVPATPFGDETIQGARNRANILCKNFYGQADLFVGLESGLVERYTNMYEECWCIIKDRNNAEFSGYSSGFMLPREITEHMENGRSHIETLKDLSIKLQLDHRDTWSIYSRGEVSRLESIKEAFRNAIFSVEYFLQRK